MDFTFLICSERSGSNLITKIMDRHSQYCGPSPTHIFRILLENRHRYGNLNQPENWNAFLEDSAAIMNTMLGVWSTRWNAQSLNELVPFQKTADVLKAIYENEALANGKKKVFIKENHLYRYIPFILSEFDTARFVYVVRDPRDMALSWKRSPSLRGGVIRAANTWKNDQSESVKLLSYLMEQERMILLRYEDLLTNPEYELCRLCNFLEIIFEPQMLTQSPGNLTVRNAHRAADWENLRNPLMRSNFHKFNGQLLEEEVGYVEKVCQEEMEFLGYRRESDTVLSVEELESMIAIYELYEKPEYIELPEHERQIRTRRFAVLKKIKQRPVESCIKNLTLSVKQKEAVPA
jgi:hypothetical protein